MPRHHFLAAGASFVLLIIHLAVASTITQAATRPTGRIAPAVLRQQADHDDPSVSPDASGPEAKHVDALSELPERFEGPDISRPFGERRAGFRPGVWAQFCREIRAQGARVVVIQARGSRTSNPYADLLLEGAREQGLATAAYVFLNFDKPDEPGDVQVRAALKAVGGEARHLAFFVLDVENGNAGTMSPAERVNRIGQAADAVVRAGLRPVMYAKNTGGHTGEWRDMTANSPDFSYMPLWVPRYDSLPMLDCDGGPGQEWEPFGGWRERAGKQYNGDVTSATAPPMEVDNNVFDHSVLEGPSESHAYSVTPLVKIQQGTISHNSETGEITSAVRISNRSHSTIYGPISLAVSSLGENVNLVNAAGTTTHGEAADRPYVAVSDKPLPPNSSARVVLRLASSDADDGQVNIAPHLCVLAGSGER